MLTALRSSVSSSMRVMTHLLPVCHRCNAAVQANFKPNAKRLELATALQTRGPNYKTDAAPEQRMQALTLSSHVVDLPASFAVGCLKGDRLVLSPLHEAVQMRPQMAYVNDKKQPEQNEANGEEKPLRVRFSQVKQKSQLCQDLYRRTACTTSI